ncbi:MAG: cell wall-binding repeat-containing protein, partial [Atopobiaceae bacterium]|nr:cell wall-binding repeat-containing protein [Atopobiaceae bacterium]
MRCKTFQKPLALLLSAALVLELVPAPAMAEVLPSDQEDVLEVVDEQNSDEGVGGKQESDAAVGSVQEESSADIDKDGQPADSAGVDSSDGVTAVTQEEGAELTAQYLDPGEIGLMDDIGITGNSILDANARYTIVGGPAGWTNSSATVTFNPVEDGTRESHEGSYAVVTDPKDHTVLNGLAYEENGFYWSLPEGMYTMTFDVNGTAYTTESVYKLGYTGIVPVLFNSYYGSTHADDFVVKDAETGDRLTTIDSAKDVEFDFAFDAATYLKGGEEGIYTGPNIVSITLLNAGDFLDTDDPAATIAQQMATGDFSSWPSQTTWDDFMYGIGLGAETTIYPSYYMEHGVHTSYRTTPPDKHGTVKIEKVNFNTAYQNGGSGRPDNYDNQLTSGLYFPVARFTISGEDYIYVYNPITVEATQPSDAKAPTITTTSLPSTMVNNTYTATLEGKTGSPDSSKPGTMSWSITEGELPEGLELDGNTGKINGMPATPGTYPFTATLTEVLEDGEPRSSSRLLSIRVLDEVALGEIDYDQDPIWSDGTQHQVEITAPVLVDLTDPEYNLQKTKAYVVIHQSNDKGPIKDVQRQLTITSDQQVHGYGIVDADATEVTGIEVRLELRNNNDKPVYRSTPDGGQEPFIVTATVDNPNIPFGGLATFPKLSLKSDEPVTSARVRVWPDGQDSTSENTQTEYIDIRDGCEFSLVEGGYVFTIEASVGQADSWVDVMGSSETGKLVSGTNPKQYRFSVTRGKTTEIDATFSAEKIAYHNATVLFEDEYGGYESDLCSWYSVEWYRRTGGKDVLVGTGNTVVLEKTSDPLYVKAIPDGSYSATWDASPLVEVNGKVATVKVPRKPHFSVEATLAFASGWDYNSAWRLGVIQIARPCNDNEFTTDSEWVYQNPITLDNITPGTVLTYTPVDESMCRSVSYTVKDITDNKITLTAPHARGIVTFEDLNLVKADDVNLKSDDERSARVEPIALNYGGTKVKVTKGEGDAQKTVKFYVADDSRLRILDDEANLVPGTKYNITVTVNDYSGTYNPFCSAENAYAASETFTATLEDNGDYLASATIDPVEIDSRGACNINFVKRSDNYVDLYLYNSDGNRVASGWWYSNGEHTYRTPFLPQGDYKLYAVDGKAIESNKYNETQTAAGLVALVGNDERVIKSIDITINNNEMGALKEDFVLPVGTSRGLVDAAESMVTAEGSYGDNLTIRLHAEVIAQQLIKDNAHIEIYTNQPSNIGETGYTNPQALSINGKAIAINRWNNLFDGTQNMTNGTLRVRLDEARKQNEACGEFPMDMTLIIPRTNTDKTEVWAWLVSDGERSLIGYYDEIPEDVSVTAPISVAWKTFSVHGMARLNSAVDICVDGMLVAQTWADEYGFFTSEITLPDDIEDGDEFAVTATATWTQGGTDHTATSEAQDVTYSTTEPAVERITMFYQDSVNGPYHAVKLYDRGELSSKYLGIYRPGYEDASNQMHYVFMAEIVNPQCATDVKINVVRSDEDLELDTRMSASDIALKIPDVQYTIDLRSGLQAMASFAGCVQRNAAGDIIVDALDRGTAFVTDPVILSYAPEEVYVTFDDVLTEPQTIDPPDTFLGFKSVGVTQEGLSGALTAINTSDHLKIVNASDNGDTMTLVDSASAAKQYMAKPDGEVDEWLAVNLGGEDGWLKVHHTNTITAASSSEAKSAISKAQKANDDYVKQIDGEKVPSVKYEGRDVVAVCMGYDNDPTNVYFVETTEGGNGTSVDMMYQYSIGTTGRSLYTRIIADRHSCTRIDWDETTGKRTTMTFTIDGSQLPDAMGYFDMSVMWQYILNSTTAGFRDAASSLGMDAEEIDDCLGVSPQAEESDNQVVLETLVEELVAQAEELEGESETAVKAEELGNQTELEVQASESEAQVELEAQGPVGDIAKSKTVKQKIWELFGCSTELEGMSDEEINYLKAYVDATGGTTEAGTDKSLYNWYDKRESEGKPNTLKELKSAWGTEMFKKSAEIAATTSVPGKYDGVKLALQALEKSVKPTNKGSKNYSPAFRRMIEKLRKEQEEAKKDHYGENAPPLPKLPPEKPKPKSKPKTTPKPKPKSKTKTKTKTRGKHASKTNAKRQSGKGAKIKWDPSGIVYEAVLSNPVEGATVQLYTYNVTSNSAVFVDSSKFGVEPNPQTTGADGHYEWYVPEGWWQVRASKEGYSSFSTGDVNVGANYGIDATRDLDGDGIDEAAEYWMPVLPIQLDVNLPLKSTAKPTVAAIEGDSQGVVVEFSKYMEPGTVTADLFTVAGKTPSKIEPVNLEEAGDGTKGADDQVVKYASKFKLYYAQDTKLEPGTHKVEVTMTDSAQKAKSYAGSAVDKLPYKGTVEVIILGPWDRYAGDTALDTGKAVVEADGGATFPEGRGGTVIVATNDGYWDALAAAGLAGTLDAPVLITNKKSLSAQTKTEIQRLKPERVLITGGTAAVSDKVMGEIGALGVKTERIFGDNAVATAVEIYKAGSGWSKTAIVATSSGYWDALSVAPYAWWGKAPIFLTDAKGNIGDAALSAIEDGAFERVVIVGGTAAVTEKAQNKLEATVTEVVRLSGDTALDTSGKIAEWEVGEGMGV